MTAANGQQMVVRAESHGPGLAQAGRDDGLVMVVSPAEARRRVQELQAFVQEVMVQDVDYGVIPGTDKPSLYQPGAQKLAEMYGFASDFEDVTSVEDWEKAFFFYRRKCILTSRRDGRFIGAGIGSCNSREDKYAGRWVFDNEVPKGVDIKTLPSKEFRKRNGTGTFRKYRVPNPDIFSLVNTIEKMACKRSYIHAVIAVTRSAGLFTQDVEDLPEEVYGRPEEVRSWARTTAPTGPSVYDELRAQVAAATSKPELNRVAASARKAKQEGRLSTEEYSALAAASNARAAELSAPPPKPPSKPAIDEVDDDPMPERVYEREPGEEG
jgi:hypothetical protein